MESTRQPNSDASASKAKDSLESQQLLSTAESVMCSIRKRPFDDYRGINREGGWWIDFEESKILAMNEEWWTETETSMTEPPNGATKQVPTLKDKKLWLFETGTMHLGSWKSIQFGKGGKICVCQVEYGIACISFVAKPPRQRGFCYVGEFYNGCKHGLGRSFWLPNSQTWKSNSLEGSQIKQQHLSDDDAAGDDEAGLPYEYVGKFQNNRKHDSNGIVTLKNKTKKKGPWLDDVVVATCNAFMASEEKDGVDWWTHHHDLIGPLDISSPETRKKKSSIPTPPSSGSTIPIAAKRRKGGEHKNQTRARKQPQNRTSTRNTLPASATENTAQAATATQDPYPVPVNVTPDSTNSIDHHRISSGSSPTAVRPPRVLLPPSNNASSSAANVLARLTADDDAMPSQFDLAIVVLNNIHRNGTDAQRTNLTNVIESIGDAFRTDAFSGIGTEAIARDAMDAAAAARVAMPSRFDLAILVLHNIYRNGTDAQRTNLTHLIIGIGWGWGCSLGTALSLEE